MKQRQNATKVHPPEFAPTFSSSRTSSSPTALR